MPSDREIDTLLGAAAATLAILTDGIRVRGSYRFEALEVKGLDRRTDGVLLPAAPDEPIWVIEVQARADAAVYHRTVVELGLVGERHPGRTVRGLILFATPALDPRAEPWHSAARHPDAPLRVAYLQAILEALEQRAPAHPRTRCWRCFCPSGSRTGSGCAREARGRWRASTPRRCRRGCASA
jgi:hypothetical protein